MVLCETLRELKVPYSILTFNYNTEVTKSSESKNPQGGALLDRIRVGGDTNDQWHR